MHEFVWWTEAENFASSTNNEVTFPAEFVMASVLSAWQTRQSSFDANAGEAPVVR